jgi:hypothetical protein
MAISSDSSSRMSGVPRASGLLGLGQARLDVAHGVVAEAAHQAAGKARQVVARRHLDAVHELGDEVERVAVVAALDQAVVGEQQHRVAMHLDAGRAARPMIE